VLGMPEVLAIPFQSKQNGCLANPAAASIVVDGPVVVEEVIAFVVGTA